jgi:hypothetical protein
MATGALTVGMVTFDARDARALAGWWARQTGGHVVADHDGEFLVVATDGAGPRHELSDFTWVVLADPEGNQFCVSGDH